MDQILYDYALSHAGLPYLWGGASPLTGFDCSGLVGEILEAAGALPRGYRDTALGLHGHFAGNTCSVPVLGSLVFYGDPISHVAFCLSSDLMLEAGSGDHTTLTRQDAERQHAFVRVRPISSRKDLVGFVLPPYSWRK